MLSFFLLLVNVLINLRAKKSLLLFRFRLFPFLVQEFRLFFLFLISFEGICYRLNSCGSIVCLLWVILCKV